MFAFLFPPRPAKTRSERPQRFLAVELLEGRDCPSSLTLDVTVLTGHQVRLSGQVIGDFAAGSSVSFSGVVSGNATIAGDGTYTFTTSSASEGDVYAVGMFGGQAFTDSEPDLIDVLSPSVTLSVADLTDSTVTLSGMLTGADIADQSIEISGAPISSVTTNSAGFFSFTLNRQDLETVQVSETDLWGQTSNTAQVNVANVGPWIREFTAIQNVDGSWTFRGRVLGDGMQGLSVSLGGLNSLIGESATIDASGWFTFTKFLATGETGDATAQTMNANGQASNLAYATVS